MVGNLSVFLTIILYFGISLLLCHAFMLGQMHAMILSKFSYVRSSQTFSLPHSSNFPPSNFYAIRYTITMYVHSDGSYMVKVMGASI